jgi:MFS family permease
MACFSFLKLCSGFDDHIIVILGFCLLTAVFSGFFSSRLIQKIRNRFTFIFYWMIAGIFISPLFALIGAVSLLGTIFLACLFGLYFGFGYPVIMGYFSANTVKTNRATIGGFAVLFTSFSFVFMFMFVPSILSVIISSASLISAISLTVWSFAGLIAFLVLKPVQSLVTEDGAISYKQILKDRSVILYFIIWLMFSIVNTFVYPVLSAAFDDANLVTLVTVIETALGGALAVVFGFLADRLGRRRLLLFGSVMLGLGYAVLALFPSYTKGLYFYTITDAVAWGIFCPLFLITIWSDLAGKKGSEKFFMIGILPYLFSVIIEVVTRDSLLAMVDMTGIFAFVCVFLLIALFPLFVVTDTLSAHEKCVREIEDYSDKAQRIADDFANNSQKSNGLLAKVRNMLAWLIRR